MYDRSSYANNTPVWALIAANVFVFLLTLFSPVLVYFLGLQPILFPVRPWTIITNMFVHGGFGHILTNMLTLYFFGTYLLRLVGTRRFLLIYFIGGLAGNILLLLLLPIAPFGIAIGASGAVFAVGGALTILRPKLRVFIFPIPAPLPLWVAVLGGFIILSFVPGVAWGAHLGGLLCGLLMGRLFRRSVKYYW